MAEPRDVLVRRPAVAGRFYPADPRQCREAAQRLIQQARATGRRASQDDQPHTPHKWIGGIVPHAGWICSGAIAAQTLDAMAGAGPVDLVVIFGAVHTPLDLETAALDSHLQWVVPNGQHEVAEPVRRSLASQSELFVIDDRFHDREHAVEVELPLVREVWPDAAILPIEVPLDTSAPEIGRRTAQQVAEGQLRAVYLASSDLTHYGPAYRFAPAGGGQTGLDWARDNDRRLLETIARLEPEAVLREVAAHHNACGGGAIAAMLAACREHGAAEARVLSHANSCQTLARVAPQSDDNAVGYASVVVG